MSFKLKLKVQPYKYLESSVGRIYTNKNTSPGKNPCSGTARPEILINGTGNVDITILGKKMSLKGLQSGYEYYIDSENYRVYQRRGNDIQNWNDKTTGRDFFEVKYGETPVIDWTGNITACRVAWRWRDLI